MQESVEVKNLSKIYKISSASRNYLTLRERLQKFIPRMAVGKTLNSEEFWALKNISFSLKKGQILGIIGPNGAGKSTLLKILSRITPPTEGIIKIKGHIASLLEVGTGFHPELTGRENIHVNGAILGMTNIEIRKKFEEIVEFSGIKKFLDSPVKRYSSGMQVRLAFSIAAHLETEILLVDEVLAVGDLEFQKKCLGKMDEVVKNSGKTIIFVSHNLGAIKDLCPNSMLLVDGEIKSSGETNSIIEEYMNSFDRNIKNKKFFNRFIESTSKEAFFNIIKIRDKAGKERAIIEGGSDIIFEIDIISRINSLSCVIAIPIRDRLGNLLYNLISVDYKKEIFLHKGINKIYIKLINNILRNGFYDVSLWLGKDIGQQPIDYIKNAGRFQVDNYNRGNYRAASILVADTLWGIDTVNFQQQSNE